MPPCEYSWSVQVAWDRRSWRSPRSGRRTPTSPLPTSMLDKAEAAVDTANERRRRSGRRRAHRRLVGGLGRRARPADACRRRPQRLRPALQPADLRGRVRRRLPLRRHGDEPVGSARHQALREDRYPARRRPVRPVADLEGPRSDGAVRDGRRARLLRRRRPVRRRRTVQRDPRDRRPRRRRPGGRRLRLRSDVLDLDHDRGVPQPAGDLRTRARLVHDRAVLRAGDLHVPRGHRPAAVRQRRARRGHPHAALDRHPAGHVQVRPRRGVHRRAQDAAQARPALDRDRRGQGHAGVTARRGGRDRCPTRRRWAT